MQVNTLDEGSQLELQLCCAKLYELALLSLRAVWTKFNFTRDRNDLAKLLCHESIALAAQREQKVCILHQSSAVVQTTLQHHH